MFEMYNFRNIVQITSFKRLFKEVDEPKRALLSFQTTEFTHEQFGMKTFGTQSCETELAKGPGTSYRIIKLTRVVIFFYLRRIKRGEGVGNQSFLVLFLCHLYYLVLGFL